MTQVSTIQGLFLKYVFHTFLVHVLGALEERLLTVFYIHKHLQHVRC